MTDYLFRCNACGWVKRKSEYGPCPAKHVGGFTLHVPTIVETKPEAKAEQLALFGDEADG